VRSTIVPGILAPVLLTRSLSVERASELMADQSQLQPTYSEVGASLTDSFPAGYRHDRYEARLGTDDAAFAAGADGLRHWVAHRGAGVEVMPAHAGIAEGTTVVLALPLGPVRAIAACRIVSVVDERTRFGFAYGTLPLHPEQGEESFIIERDDAGMTWFRVAAFSRPRDALARVGAPLSRVIQTRVTRAYLRAMVALVAPSIDEL
jgi:uncharacterized protein (UPF0548 family)